MSTFSQRSNSEALAQFTYEKLYARNASEPKGLGLGKRGRYDFAVAYPDPSSLPLAGLLDGLRQAMEEEGGDLSLYAHPQGYTPLREFVAAKLQRDRVINVTAEEIILADGSSQPIHMIAETLLDPGDVALTEDFVYAGTLNTLRRFRADLRGVATDEEGDDPGGDRRDDPHGARRGQAAKADLHGADLPESTGLDDEPGAAQGVGGAFAAV